MEEGVDNRNLSEVAWVMEQLTLEYEAAKRDMFGIAWGDQSMG